MGYFVLDGKASSDFGVKLSGTSSWGTPERNVETAGIPGRNGELITYVGGWKNVQITYPAWIAREFNDRFEAFAEWWNAHTDNYYELTDVYHPQYFRLARPVSKLDPNVGTLNRSGTFELKLDCKPQKYLRDGAFVRHIASGETLVLKNPTMYDAYPLVIAKSIQPGGSAIDVIDELDSLNGRIQCVYDDGIYDYADLDIVYDAETHEATCQFPGSLVSANSAVTETFPNELKHFVIPAGATVTLESWKGDHDIYPRWYTI